MLGSILVLMLLPSGWVAVQVGVQRLRDDREPARSAALAAFLRAQRARLRPADVGLPEGSAAGRRRTPGLRREEVAHLSGVGVTWYTWLEQGRDIAASAHVIDALARALLLNPDQHQHLRDLAGLTALGRETPVDDVLPRLQRLVDAAAPNIASVYDILDHPRIGRIAFEMFQFRLVEHPDLLMVMHVPASNDDLERVTALLERP